MAESQSPEQERWFRVYAAVMVVLGGLAVMAGLAVAVIERRSNVLLIVGAVLFALPFLIVGAKEIRASWGDFALTFKRMSEEVAEVEEAAKGIEESLEGSQIPPEVQNQLARLTDDLERLRARTSDAVLAAALGVTPVTIRRRKHKPFLTSHVPDVDKGQCTLSLRARAPTVFSGVVICEVIGPTGRHSAIAKRDLDEDKLFATYPDDFREARPLVAGDYAVRWYELPPTAKELREDGGRDLAVDTFRWPPPSLEELLEMVTPKG